MLRVLSALVLLALAGLLLLWPFEEPEPRTPATEGAPTERTAGPARQARLPEQATADAAPPTARREVEAPTAPTPDVGGLATVTGRCVDEAGAPLAGVSVALDGWTANSERMAEHRLNHGEVVWQDPDPVESDADGRFTIRFAPPPPFQFSCDVQPTDRVEVRFRWAAIEPGEVKELGDVELVSGVAVTGVLTDPSGLGLADVHGTLAAPRSASGWTVFDRRDEHGRQQVHRFPFRTGPRGAFTIDRPVPGGRFEVELRQHELLEPSEPFLLEAPRDDLRLVARASEPVDPGATIEGRVVDDRGQPVLGTRIFAARLDGGVEFGGGMARREGRFVLQRSEQHRDVETSLLGAERDGYVPWLSDAPIRWGMRDVLIRLTAGPPLTLRVTRGNDGAPVERFGIVLAPDREGIHSSSDQEMLHLGDHPGGVLDIPRVTPGPYRLSVRPPEDSGLSASAPEPIEIEAGRPLDLTVVLPGRTRRTVELVRADGTPVADAKVEWLFNHGGYPVTMHTWAMDGRNARMNSPQVVAELIAGGVTDERGRFEIEAASGRDYALRLPGPGHVPQIVQPARIEADGPLRLVVASGATVRGRVGPPEILDQLLAEARGVDGAAAPAVRLLGRDAHENQTFPGGTFQDSRLAIDEEGRFVAEGVPPGRWAIGLTWQQSHLQPDGSVGGSSSPQRQVHEPLDLAEGASVDVEIDLSALRREPVEFTVRHDGAPCQAVLQLRGDHGQRSDGRPDRSNYTVYTDETGRVAQPLRAGNWTVQPAVQIEERWAPAPGVSFAVVAGQPTKTVDLELRVAQRRVQVLLPDGEPAVGVTLQPLNDAGAGLQATGGPTDAAGYTTLYGSAGTYGLRTIRRPLMEFRAQIEWRQKHPEAGYSALFVGLEDVDLLIGESSEAVVRLPASWTELPK